MIPCKGSLPIRLLFRTSGTDIPPSSPSQPVDSISLDLLKAAACWSCARANCRSFPSWNLTLLSFEAKHEEDSALWPQSSWSVRQILPEPQGNGEAPGIPRARASPCPRRWEQLPAAFLSVRLQSRPAELGDPPVAPPHSRAGWMTGGSLRCWASPGPGEPGLPCPAASAPQLWCRTGREVRGSPASTGGTVLLSAESAAGEWASAPRGDSAPFPAFFCSLNAGTKPAPLTCRVELNPGSSAPVLPGLMPPGHTAEPLHPNLAPHCRVTEGRSCLRMAPGCSACEPNTFLKIFSYTFRTER